jgi:predicted phosphodiesterase
MKLALISDIHSNLQALESVLGAIDSEGVDAIYCMGDVVGYGADPGPCVDLVRERCAGVVLGNHDHAVANDSGMRILPEDGQIAALHNRDALTEYQTQWLGNRPYVLAENGVTCVHSSPRDPDRWLRIEALFVAQSQFDYFDSDVCFVGHTHQPAILSDRLGVLRVRAGHRFLINVGSVGQPRDGDSRAAVGYFDTESFSYRLERIPYNVDQASQRIMLEQLPRSLATRLQMGR